MSSNGLIFNKVINSTGHIVELFIEDKAKSGTPSPDQWWVLNCYEAADLKIGLTEIQPKPKMQLRMIGDSPSSPKGRLKVIHMHLSNDTGDLQIYEGDNIDDTCTIRTGLKVQELDLIIEPRKITFVNYEKGQVRGDRVHIITLINDFDEDQLGQKGSSTVMIPE